MSERVFETEHSQTVGVAYGRDAELAALRATLAETRSGRGGLTLVGGEAGIGKTTLVELLSKEAANRGWFVLTGHCYDLVTTPPFGPWAELLAVYRRHYREPVVPRLLIDPELLDTVSSQDEIFDTAAGFFASLAEQRPALIVLEDVHWADLASLGFLRYLARHLTTQAMQVVATYRDVELAADAPLYQLLPQLIRESRATRIDLQRLDDAAIGQLVEDHFHLGPADRRRLSAWLARSAEGNPFYIEELLRSLEQNAILQVEERLWTLGDLSRVQVPALIRQVIDQRLDAFDGQERQLLQTAAVIGEDIDLDLWRTVGETDEESLVDVIEAAEASRMLVESSEPGGLQFRHALFRQALYESLSLPRRKILHRQIAGELSGAADPDPDTVAFHYSQAGDPEAARWLIRAGDRATRAFAYYMAAERYEQAIPLLDAAGVALDERGWLYCNLALSYRYAESFRALAHLDRAREIADAIDDPELTFTVTWDRSQIRGLLGERSLPEALEAVDLYEAAVATSGSQSVGKGNVMSYGLMAHLLTRFGTYEQAEVLATRELSLPHSSERSHQIAAGWAHFTLGLTYASRGEPDRARDAFARAKTVARATGENHMFGLILNWELMELVLPFQADQPAARQRVAEQSAETWSRLTMFTTPELTQDMLPFAVMVLDGNWDKAYADAELDTRNVTMRFDGLRTLVELDVARGNLSDARVHLFDALPQGPTTEPGAFYYYSTLRIQRAAALLALEEGKLPEALEWINARRRWLEWADRSLDRADNKLLLARYYLASGNSNLAATEAHNALELASAPRQPLALLAAHRMLGEIETSAGRFDLAAQHLSEALSLATACNAPYEIALTLLSQAQLFVATGDHDNVPPLLEQIRELAVELDAQPLRHQAAAVEAQLASAPADPAAGAGLSPREVDVLQLVARGMTDAEVGAKLHISPRTVARHLQSIYNKLGVNSRTAASAFAFERGIVVGQEQ